MPRTTYLALLALLAGPAGCDGTVGPGEAEDGDLDVPEEQSLERQVSSTPPLQLYIAHGGSDAADGRSPSAPLRTLEGAQAKLRSYLPAIDRDVEIRIAFDGGKPYHGEEVVWTLGSPDHTITFMPSDFHYGMRLGDIKGRPLFDGHSVCETKRHETATYDGEHCKFFVVDRKGESRVRFYYLAVRNYATTGIALHNAGEGRNVVYGCRLERIGNLYFPGHRNGYTAIGISNSDHNVIRNNRFVDIRNRPADNRFMHAVYMNVQSSHNTVSYNDVLRVSGDPMKVRHYSNHNVIEHNTLRYGGVAAFLDWPEGSRDECFSWENIFRNNVIRCGYDGGKSDTVKLREPPEPGRDNPLCRSLGQRVRTGGNTNSCP
jgi:hypothetical protein